MNLTSVKMPRAGMPILQTLAVVAVALITLTGCAPKVGSEAWCEQLKEKPKGDWTLNEGKDYSKHCLFK